MHLKTSKRASQHSICPDCHIAMVNGLKLMEEILQADPRRAENECALCASEKTQLTTVIKCPVCGFSQLAEANKKIH